MLKLCFIIVRLFAGTVLMVSALIHLLHPYLFTFTLASYRFFPESILIVLPFAVAAIAFAVGLLLFLDRSRSILWMATFLFLGFVLMQVQAIARGLEIDCGCFGFSSHEIGLKTMMLPTVAALGCLCAAISKFHGAVPVSWILPESTPGEQ